MNLAAPSPRLLDSLPPVRGRLSENAQLSSWFQAGGRAEILFQPAGAQDLCAFLAACPPDVPLTVLGVGSNVLIRDGGIKGVVIRMGARFAQIENEGDEVLTAGSGALAANVARAAQKAGIAGLSFLAGIPGSLGGALAMNAGAHGGETKDILVSATLALRDGTLQTMTAQDLRMGYRTAHVPAGAIFLQARLRGRAGDPEAIAQEIQELTRRRADSQPQKVRTGGSTFANPEGAKAWELIDRAGCRGLRVGDAMMSDKHCNFMVNLGQASAADLEALGEEVRRRVKETTGIELRWEIRRLGQPLAKEGERT